MIRNQIIDPLFPQCPIRNVLARLCDKWSLLLLHALECNKEPMRYKDIKKSIGDISEKMLTTTLHTLEADGFVLRKAYAEIPPRVEYELTDRARSFLPHVHNMVYWALENFSSIVDDRRKNAAQKESGEPKGTDRVDAVDKVGASE